MLSWCRWGVADSREAMRVRIHCGAHEIGGCVEVESDNCRLVLDVASLSTRPRARRSPWPQPPAGAT